MEPAEAIGIDRLSAASQALVNESGFASRISWWLQHAHSAERWIQFEWAFHLQVHLNGEFSTICEHRYKRIDVALVPPMHSTTSAPDILPKAGIELKWYGNWWVDQFDCVIADIEKVRQFPFPGAAVLLFLYVKPSATLHRWLFESLASDEGVPSWDKVFAGMPHHIISHRLRTFETLNDATLYTVVIYNDVAKTYYPRHAYMQPMQFSFALPGEGRVKGE